jgi:hypothetical protein
MPFIGHSQCGDFGTESAVIAIAGIEHANSARQTARASPALLQTGRDHAENG